MDKIRLNAFQSVPADGPASLVTNQLTGYSLHALQFVMGGGAFTEAEISSLVVRNNQKDITPAGLTGTQLLSLNLYEGLPDGTVNLWFFFGDPTARTVRGQHWGDLDLSIYPGQLEIEVTIVGATTPTLYVIAHAGPPKLKMGFFNEREAATFRALRRTVITRNAAVSRDQVNVSLPMGSLIRKLGLFHTDITAVDYRKQSIVKHDNLTVAENAALGAQFARVPAAGLYMLDFIVDGNMGEAEPTVQSNGQPWNQQLAITTSDADTVIAYADVLANHGIL